MCRQSVLGLAALSDLGKRIHDTANKADEDGRNAAKGNRGIEEDQTTDRDWELVQSANHGVGGRGGDTNAPGGGIGDEDGRETRNDHGKDDVVSLLGGEVLRDVGR